MLIFLLLVFSEASYDGEQFVFLFFLLKEPLMVFSCHDAFYEQNIKNLNISLKSTACRFYCTVGG